MSSPVDVIAGAVFRSDLQNTNRVLFGEWVKLYNEAVNSTWNQCAAARPDFQVTSQDFAVVSGSSASFQVPADFRAVIDLVCNPDTAQEYSLGPFNWHNRRSPGGWYWPSVTGFGSGQGASAMRLMGWLVYVEPARNAAGTYRFWYCPRPHVCLQTVRLATVAALPACTAAGAGAGKTLTGNVNGALSVDAIAVAAGDKLLVKNQVASADDGVYTVTAPGSVSTTFVLTRTPGYDTTATIAGGLSVGDIVAVGQSDAAVPVGTQEGKFFTLTTFTAIEAAQAWTEGAALDPVLEQFIEILMLKIAIPALHRDNRGETAAPFLKTLVGADSKTGLVGEMKSFMATTRSPGPQQMTRSASDARLGGGGWGSY
jgi:hypothetical protein